MTVNINQEGPVCKVAVEGRIDTSTAYEFQQALAPLMELEKPSIEVDCSQMDYISSSGLRVFLMLKKAAMAHAGDIVLQNMKPQVKDVFDITGFSSIIKIV